jgi:hypothetical protein
MASAGARAYMGVWGLCPHRYPGAEPLVRGSGRLCPPEAETLQVADVVGNFISAYERRCRGYSIGNSVQRCLLPRLRRRMIYCLKHLLHKR